MGKRKDKSTGSESVDFTFCRGYVDEHGQWNNGFPCPKWSTKVNQQYCCGSQYKRYCCDPGEEPSTSVFPSTRSSTAAIPVSSSQEENIPLIVGLSLGGLLVFVIFIVLCCFLCPCCFLSRRRERKRPPSEGSMDAQDLRRSDVSSHTLRTSVNTQFTSTPSRGESPPPPGTTQLPLVVDTHNMDHNSGHRAHHCPNSYRGMVIGTVPPYMREEPPPYHNEMLDGIKPLTCGQFQCCSKNCIHQPYSDCCQKSCPHHKTRSPEICALEEVDPLVLHISQTSPVTNLHPQSYTHQPSQMRYGRAHSPRPVSPTTGHTPSSCRHMQIQNRYAM